MKITNISLQTYQSMNALKSVKNNAADAPAKQVSRSKNLEGASFSDLLDKKEIEFLNKNFTKPVETDRKDNRNSGRIQGKRIDILA
jgi:hypothetical protein